jgi:uncharacterized membrane protein YeaQ/YmgE (transglycosylase-associated protein family)
MSGTGILLLLTAAVLLGLIGQFIHNDWSRNEWFYIALAAASGGVITSEWLGSVSRWGPEVGGLSLVPALIGAVIASIAVELVFRRQTRTAA